MARLGFRKSLQPGVLGSQKGGRTLGFDRSNEEDPVPRLDCAGQRDKDRPSASSLRLRRWAARREADQGGGGRGAAEGCVTELMGAWRAEP